MHMQWECTNRSAPAYRTTNLQSTGRQSGVTPAPHGTAALPAPSVLKLYSGAESAAPAATVPVAQCPMAMPPCPPRVPRKPHAGAEPDAPDAAAAAAATTARASSGEGKALINAINPSSFAPKPVMVA